MRKLILAALLFFVTSSGAQTVQISDTLYNANGTAASGRLIVSAGTPFTASDGTAVGLGVIQYTIPSTGVINLSLYANVGATPSGTSYQARYVLTSGAQYTETWVVPASGPVTISAIRVNTVPSPTVLFLPTQASAVDSPADEECLTYEITGTKFEWQTCGSGGGTGILTLNGLTADPQLFAVGTSGTDFAISSASDTHTFSIPSASATARGLVTTGTQTFAGVKTFSSTIVGAISGNAGTATALETARTIGGTSFNGTANIVPATITVADTTDTSSSVALFESATGDLAPKTDGGLTYNAGTGVLTATGFSGPLTGNVTGNVSGSSGSTTGNAATATALAANGANCSSGNAPLGVDDAGAVEGCFDVATQTELDLKANIASPTFTGTVTIPTPFTLGAVSVTPTGTELNFVDGVTSAIQTQIDGKVPTTLTLTAGAGLSGGGDLSANRSFATASGEADFLASGALTCGAGTQGKAQVHTTPLQYCDNAATPALQYAAYGASDGDALAGDSIVSFFPGFTTAQLATELSDEDYEPGDATALNAALIENGTAELLGETLGTACSENQILKANASGGLDCAADADSGGSTAWDDIADPDADATIAFAGFEQTITSTLDEADHTVLAITNTDADRANNTSILDLNDNDQGDAQAIYLRMRSDVNGTPRLDYQFEQNNAFMGLPLFLENYSDALGELWLGGDGVKLTDNGDGGLTVTDQAGTSEAVTLSLRTSNTAVLSSGTGVNSLNLTGIALTVGSIAGAGPTASGQVVYDSTANALEYGDNGTNRTVANLDEAQTFTNKTLTAPTIADFTNAPHDHGDADDGGALANDLITGATLASKLDINDDAVDDDDCTGEQGSFWYDTTDSAFEFCNADSGAPAVLGAGGGDSDNTHEIPLVNCAPRSTTLAGNAYPTVKALATGANDIPMWVFTNDVEGAIVCSFVVPPQIAGTPAAGVCLYMTAAGNPSGEVRMTISSLFLAAGESIDQAYTAETAVDITLDTTAREVTRNCINLTPTVAGSDLGFIRIFRDGDATEDDAAQDMELHQATFRVDMTL